MNFDKLKYYTDLLKSIFASKTTSGTVLSSNADYAEIGEWADGNPDNEDRSGYFVMVDNTTPGITMVKGKKGGNIRGAVMKHPAFAGNGSSDKYDEKGNLLQQYDYVGWCGFVPVIDNGKCEINKKCICGDDGTAIPSDNDFGYQVIDRVDEKHILVLIEPHGDEMNRIAEKIKDGAKEELTQSQYDALSEEEKNNGTVYFIKDGTPSAGLSLLSEEGLYDLRFFNGKLSYKNGDKWIDIDLGGSSSTSSLLTTWVPTGVDLKIGNKSVTIKWKDPDDIDSIAWTSTVVVRKQGSTPTSETDGTVVLTSTSKNQYATTGYKDTGLTNGVTYYYGIFPKTSTGSYNYTCIKSATPETVNIVTWDSGSWEGIEAMLEAHYNGDIDIADYWKVGDTRRISLSSISSTTSGESQASQYVALTIIGTKHDTLATSINGVTKAAITIQSKFCLSTDGYMYQERGIDSSTWESSPRRTWCNNDFKNALPSKLVSLIKTVNKVSFRYADSSYSSYRGSKTTKDDVFLLSEMEVVGEQTFASTGGSGSDGSQYKYYETASNRKKYSAIDGTTSKNWWLRSSVINSDGDVLFRVAGYGDYAINAYSFASYGGIAPAFCI